MLVHEPARVGEVGAEPGRVRPGRRGGVGVVAAAVFIAGVLVGADSMSRGVAVPTYIADVIVAVSLVAMLVATLFVRYRVRLR